ncbi:hypothetical protein [Nocardiopsis salina]|uniref:hypothetical protein n=1 Tax=Nocardiopsis salina TaxID=245836 RepID=UPI00034AD5FA|nr:hypothetical protein [Nocardiopsis salina]
MIIWTGWGILVPLFLILGIGITGAVGEEVLPPEASTYGFVVGALLSSLAIFLLGRKLNKPEQGFHPKTGEPVVYRNRHTFFFVPMQFWAVIVPTIGLVVTVVTTLNGTA